MTTDTICETIRSALLAQATQPNGPDLQKVLELVGCVEDDPVLKRVLEVKGELVVRIRMIPIPQANTAVAEQMSALRTSCGVELPATVG